MKCRVQLMVGERDRNHVQPLLLADAMPSAQLVYELLALEHARPDGFPLTPVFTCATIAQQRVVTRGGRAVAVDAATSSFVNTLVGAFSDGIYRVLNVRGADSSHLFYNSAIGRYLQSRSLPPLAGQRRRVAQREYSRFNDRCCHLARCAHQTAAAGRVCIHRLCSRVTRRSASGGCRTTPQQRGRCGGRRARRACGRLPVFEAPPILHNTALLTRLPLHQRTSL